MNILFIRVSSIGDIIHTLPALFLIKKKIPSAKISWIVQEKAADLLINQPFLENLWVLKNNFFSPTNFLHTLSKLKEIKKTNWDAILDFQGIIKTSIFLPWLTGPKFGFDSHNARQNFTTIFTKFHAKAIYENIVQKNLFLAETVINYPPFKPFLDKNYIDNCPTLDELKKDFDFLISQKDKENVEKFIEIQSLDQFILLSPNTTWESKHWPMQNWVELAENLSKELKNVKLVLIGEPFGGQAKKVANELKLKKINIVILPKFNLLEIAYLLKKSRLLIAPDTGLLHLADFLNCRAIGIFGPTLSIKHGPFLNEFNRTNVIQIKCKHFYRKSHFLFESSNLSKNCMFSLKPNDLVEKVKFLIKN